MTVYLGRDSQCESPSMSATHATVTGFTARLENVGHKLYMDNFFSSPALFDDLCTKTINCHGTVRPKRKGMPKNCGQKIKLKWGDIKTKVTGNLTAILWNDKQNTNILTNMHSPPAQGNFCNKHEKAVKLAIVQDCNRHMEYADKSDSRTNSYSISKCRKSYFSIF